MSGAVAVVPAHNEASTVGGVVRALVAAGVFKAVVVVDDGSTDGTAEAADAAGADAVVRMVANVGKGRAMRQAVALYPGADVAFFDADLLGFTAGHAAVLAEHFACGFDQVCGLRDYGRTNVLQLCTPVITGERFVRRWVLDRLPCSCWSGYAIETAINYVVDAAGGTTCLVPMPGVTIRNKTQKVGFFEGWRRHIRMAAEMRAAQRALEASDGKTCG